MTKAKTDRNKEIYEDKKTMSWREMIIKWELSYTTLRNIVMREELNNSSNLQ